MSSSINYGDTFDRLFPVQSVPLLVNDSDIAAETLNQRYTINNLNQQSMLHALNSIFIAQPDGSHFRDYMLPFWEIAGYKTFDLTGNINSLRFRAGFDPGGISLSFPENRTALYMTDFGNTILNNSQVLLFVGGVLVSSNDYYINSIQGGFTIYVKETLTSISDKASVIVVRKFNELGVTRNYASPTINTTGTTSNPYDIIIDLSTLGNIYDIRYYKLFLKTASDNYFRPVSESLYSARTNLSNQAVFTKDNGSILGDQFIVVCTAEFWSYNFDAIVTENSNASIIDLVDNNNYPVAVTNINDLDVWLNGRLQRPNIDYWLQFGSPDSKRHPPRIIMKYVPTGPRQKIFIMSNAPEDVQLYPSIRENDISDPRGIYRFNMSTYMLRLLKNVGIVFNGGYLSDIGDGIETIADNLGLYFSNLTDPRDIYFKARFVLPTGNLNSAIDESKFSTALENFANLVGLRPDGTPADGKSALSFDFIESFVLSHNVQNVPYNPFRTWNTTLFPAGYFFVRDDLTTARTYNEPVDCRSSGLEILVPWEQLNQTTYFDCRNPLPDLGYTTNVSLDFRNY
jgi:hypothetical protein